MTPGELGDTVEQGLGKLAKYTNEVGNDEIMALLMMQKDRSKEVLDVADKWEHLSERNEPESVLSVFQPRFIEIYNEYAKYLQKMNKYPVVHHEHLFATCLEHIVDFSLWARQSPETTSWVFQTVLSNQDLRPELRNGLAMLLMYTMATAKANTMKGNSDMFSIIMDSNFGLGIIHKTSLRVYNDPFSFFSFLKICMTGLIECGVLKENERNGQTNPKVRRRHFEIESEFESFTELKNTLISIIKNDLIFIKQKVEEIVVNWQNKIFKMGNFKRFSVALSIAKCKNVNATTASLPSSLASYVPVDALGKALVSKVAPLAAKKQAISEATEKCSGAESESSCCAATASVVLKSKRSYAELDCKSIESSPSEANKKDKFSASTGIQLKGPPEGGLSTSSSSLNVMVKQEDDVSKIIKTFINVLRFDRLGPCTWEIHQIQVFDVLSFLQNPSVNCVFALDSGALTAEEKDKRFVEVKRKGLNALEAEFRGRGGIRTLWPRAEFQQLKSYMDTCLAVCGRKAEFQGSNSGSSVLTKLNALSSNLPFKCAPIAIGGGKPAGCCGSESNSTTSAPSGSAAPQVSLAYERVVQYGFVVRRSAEISLPACWRSVYLSEVQEFSQMEGTSFVKFISSLFPQTKYTFDRAGNDCDLDAVLVYYCGRENGVSCDALAAQLCSEFIDTNFQAAVGCFSNYQCIGTLLSPVEEILPRLQSRAIVHDFLLVKRQ